MSALSAADQIVLGRKAQRIWAAEPMKERARVIKGLRIQIANRREQIIATISAETGKPLLDALAGDVLVTLEQMRFYESNAARILRVRRVGKPPILFSGVRFADYFEPHGVVLVFAPANYPLQLALVPAITALFAGNSVILKCSERTTRTARMIDDLCSAASFPANLLQVVCDAPEGAGALIDAGPDLLFFTGSSENGRAVAERAAKRLIPTVLELGGKDAAIVFSDCNLERTVEGVVYGAFSNAGQVCVGIKRLFVQQDLYMHFIDLLVARIRQLHVGTQADSDLGELHGKQNRDRFGEQIRDARRRGATVHTPDDDFTGSQPVLLSGVPAGSRLMVEESFGPVMCISPFETEQEAIALANDSAFALSASVWSSDIKRAQRVSRAMRTGSCAINDVIRNIGNPNAAFGGNGASGYGRYHGAQGLRTFSRIKSVMTSNGRKRHEINWFPFTEQTFKRLNAFIGFGHGKGGLLSALRRLLLSGLCVSLPTLLGAQGSGRLFIHVTLPENTHGPVAYLVFSAKDGFPNDKAKAFRSGFTPVSGTTATIDVGTLTPGRYAVSVYQDVNENHKLDSGILGIPKEPVGVSNNPKPRFGPPRFDDCAFEMGNSDKTISIALVTVK